MVPGLLGTATQKSWRGLSADAEAMEQVITKSPSTIIWEAIDKAVSKAEEVFSVYVGEE